MVNRQKFEEWVRSLGLNVDTDNVGYTNQFVRYMWRAWKESALQCEPSLPMSALEPLPEPTSGLDTDLLTDDELALLRMMGSSMADWLVQFVGAKGVPVPGEKSRMQAYVDVLAALCNERRKAALCVSAEVGRA